MGHKLIDIMSTDDRGLIGFTEIGEEVQLNAPKPMSLKSLISDEFYKIKGKNELKKMQNYLIKMSNSDVENLLIEIKDEEYIQLGSLDICGGMLITNYNIYTKRKTN
ncbi:MAG: hypothetical protein PHH54_02685 [Candidatus Nanoarchaeia archaeon]|nr:hypothetical protein [Candidatus Nanoarchaeia archaeon]MDD5740867.1 hypothetical protein [Candidatus Nanoarchaeia archaeon]